MADPEGNEFRPRASPPTGAGDGATRPGAGRPHECDVLERCAGARNLLVTVFGDALLPHGPATSASVASPAQLLASFGCNERLVRTSLTARQRAAACSCVRQPAELLPRRRAGARVVRRRRGEDLCHADGRGGRSTPAWTTAPGDAVTSWATAAGAGVDRVRQRGAERDGVAGGDGRFGGTRGRAGRRVSERAGVDELVESSATLRRRACPSSRRRLRHRRHRVRALRGSVERFSGSSLVTSHPELAVKLRTPPDRWLPAP